MESTERWVPKVHPATRPVEPEDPYSLHATLAAGDPEVMLQCLVQEYAWIGWDTERILALFRDPFYPALHALRDLYGDEGVRARVAALLNEGGVFQFDVAVEETPETEEPVPELIQLSIRNAEGDSHAEGL
jgi:hypothetical protein